MTGFRAAVIIGSESASFTMMHHLVNRLPIMFCLLGNSQDAADGTGDVIRYLIEAIGKPKAAGKISDISVYSTTWPAQAAMPLQTLA